MLLENPGQSVYSKLSPDAALQALSTGKWSDEEALKLVVQDAQRAENFEAAKQWVAQWPTAAVLYQSPYAARYWEGTQTERANIPFFTVATVVNSLVPQIMNGIFYDDPPFMARPRPKTSEDATTAATAIISYQLEDIDFEEQLRLGITNALLFGTGMWKYGWESFTRKQKEYRRKPPLAIIKNPVLGDVKIHDDESIEEITVEEFVDRPFFEHIVNLRHVLVDPGLQVPDIRKAKYVVHRMYLTWEELDKLRERPGYKIPLREDLLKLFLPPVEPAEAAPGETSIRNPLWDLRSEARYEKTTEDPFNQPLEVLERWDNNKVMIALNKKLIICNDDNPYGQIPFFSVGWWDVPEAFWSMGLAKTIGSEQRLQQGVMNAWLDGVALNLNGVYVRVRGKSVPTQSIRVAPGKIVEVDNKGDIEPLERMPAVPEAMVAMQSSQARAEAVSGANELLTQGSMPAPGQGRTSLGRTATGANLLSSGSGTRIQSFVEKLSNHVMVPFLYAVHAMNGALLPEETVKHLLNVELQKAYKGDVVEIFNARIKFSISAAARLQARRNMAQALPIMIQFLTNAPTIQALAVEGKKVDQAAILKMMFEVSDWKNYYDVVKDMTPQDMQRWQSMQPGARVAAQMAGKQQMQKQAFDQKSDLVDQENIARAGREILREAITKSAEPEEVLGSPTGPGFGANA